MKRGGGSGEVVEEMGILVWVEGWIEWSGEVGRVDQSDCISLYFIWDTRFCLHNIMVEYGSTTLPMLKG